MAWSAEERLSAICDRATEGLLQCRNFGQHEDLRKLNRLFWEIAFLTTASDGEIDANRKAFGLEE